MRQLYLNRSKIFISVADGAERRVALTRTVNGKPVAAPDWVCTTSTYTLGVKDGSIVDLTPPKAAIAAPVATVQEPEEVVVEEPAIEPATEGSAVIEEDSDDAEADKPATAKRGGKKADAGAATGLKRG
jgi:hypothetical protein